MGVIKAFISIAKPNDADRKKHAALLDLRVGLKTILGRPKPKECATYIRDSGYVQW